MPDVKVKTNLTAIVAPTATDDSSKGYSVFSPWVDTQANRAYFCADATKDNAVWREVAYGQQSGAVLTRPQINDDSSDHQYIIEPEELAADRTLNLPLLTANDTFCVLDTEQVLTNKTLVNPVIVTDILDAAGDEVLAISVFANAVNEFTIFNAATGNDPELRATGDDANIDIRFNAKGTGDILLHTLSTGNVGVGIAAPLSKFHVESADDTYLVEFHNTQDGTGLDGSGLYIESARDDSASDAYLIRAKNAGTVDFYVRADGKVNIPGGLDFDTLKDALGPGTALQVDVSELGFRVRNQDNTVGEGTGFGFAVSTSETDVGAAIVFERTGANSAGDLHFATKPTGAAEGADLAIDMTLNEDGHLGVGTTSPVARFHTNSANQNQVALFESTDPGAYLYFQDDTTPSSNDVGIGVEADKLHLITDNAQRVTVTTAGDVGVGTITPDYKLEVEGSGDYAGILSFSNATRGQITWGDGSWNAGANFILRANSGQWLGLGANASNDDLIIDASGNVGIGLQDPDEKLEVYGNVKLTNPTGGRGLTIEPSPTGTWHTFEGVGTTAGYLFNNNSRTLLSLNAGSGNVGIGGAAGNATWAANAPLNVGDGSICVIFGADAEAQTLTTLTIKRARLAAPHYDTTEEPVAMLYSNISSANNYLNVGGGSSLMNASTFIQFYTAANTTTPAGTRRMIITEDGNVGIGSVSDPEQRLHVQENQNASTEVLIENNTSGTDARAALTLTSDASGSAIIASVSPLYTTVANVADSLWIDAGENLSVGINVMAAATNGTINFWTASRTTGRVMHLDEFRNVLIGNGTDPAVDPPDGWLADGDATALEIRSRSSARDTGLFIRRSDHFVGCDIWADGGTGQVYIDSRWNNATADSFVFRTRTSGTPVTAMTIEGSGEVGVFGGLAPVALSEAFTVMATNATVSNQTGALIRGDTSGNGLYSAMLGFANASIIRSGIAGIQESADADVFGLSFFVHPTSTSGDPVVEAMRLNKDGDLYCGEQISTMANYDEEFRCGGRGNFQEGSGAAIVMGADGNATTLTNSTEKWGRLGAAHYTIAEEPIAAMYVQGAWTTNVINIGGGTSQLNAATHLRFYTAANNTTTFGTMHMEIDSAGMIGIGTETLDALSGKVNIHSDKDAIVGLGTSSANEIDVSELHLKLHNDTSLGDAMGVGIGFGVDNVLSNVGAAIVHQRVGTDSYGSLHFATKPSGAGDGADLGIDMTLNHEGHLGINNEDPTWALTIQEGDQPSIVFGADALNTLLDGQSKIGRMGVPHYTNAEEPAAILRCDSLSSSNVLMFGGGTNRLNAATQIEFWTGATNTTLTGTKRGVIDSSGRFGIGTDTPASWLEIIGSSIQLILGDNDNDLTNKIVRQGCRHYDNSEESVTIFNARSTATDNTVYIGGSTSAQNAATGIWFYTALNTTTTTGTFRGGILTTGDWGVGTGSIPTGGGKALVFGDNGGDPSAMGVNTAGIYAKDVSGTVEMFAIDEATNVTQLSPHDPETGEWIFYSENQKTGRRIRVDMERFFKNEFPEYLKEDFNDVRDES